MGPNIRALVAFLEAGGKQGIITSPSNIGRGLAGESGTYMVPS